jgi:hypothetical protein
MFAVQLLGIHQPAYYPSFGEGFDDAFRNVDVAKADIFLKLGIQPGEKFVYENAIYGAFRNRTGSALAKGDWVKTFFGGATRLGTVGAAPAPTTAAFASSFNLVAGDVDTPDKSIPSWLFITSGTGIGQRRRPLATIDSTSAVTPNLITVALRSDFQNVAATSAPDAFGTAPVAADGLSIICPWEVQKTASVYDLAQGVCMGTTSDGQYGVVCLAGLALAKCVGSTDALVAGQPIVISATAGVAKGRVAVPGSATIAMQEAGAQVGYAIDAYSGATALRQVWVSGNFAL